MQCTSTNNNSLSGVTNLGLTNIEVNNSKIVDGIGDIKFKKKTPEIIKVSGWHKNKNADKKIDFGDN